MICLSLIFLLAGCNLFEQRTPNLVINIEDDIVVSLWEDLNPDQRTLKFQLTSMDTMECSDVIFDHEAKHMGHIVDIRIKGLIQPEVCDLTPSPARTDIDFQLPISQYQVEFQIGDDIMNAGSIHVGNDVYILTMLTTHGLQLNLSELRRIPERAIWGYIALPEPNNDLSSTFLNTMLNIGQPMNIEAGNYGYFSLYDSGHLSMKDEPSGMYLTRFVYRLDDTLISLETKIQDFKNEFGEQAEIAVHTWEGQSF